MMKRAQDFHLEKQKADEMTIGRQLIILLFWPTFFTSFHCFGQNSSYGAQNLRTIDSFRSQVEGGYCQGKLFYPESYSKSELRKIRRLINIVNQFLSLSDDKRKDDLVFKHYKKNPRSLVISENGILERTTLGFSVDYARAEISFVSVGNFVVKRKIIITPSTVHCDKYGDVYFDFRLLSKEYAKAINFPFRLNMIGVIVDTLDLQALKAASQITPGYTLFTDAIQNPHEWAFRNLFRNQYDFDSSKYDVKLIYDWDILNLTKDKRADILETLLYSPNYCYQLMPWKH